MIHHVAVIVRIGRRRRSRVVVRVAVAVEQVMLLILAIVHHTEAISRSM